MVLAPIRCCWLFTVLWPTVMNKQTQIMNREIIFEKVYSKSHKGWFPYDCCNRWKKNFQHLLGSRGNHFLAIEAITAIIWKPAYMETAQRSKWQRLLNVFGSDRRDHMETSLKFILKSNSRYTSCIVGPCTPVKLAEYGKIKYSRLGLSQIWARFLIFF